MSAFAAMTLQNNSAVNVTFNPQSIDADGVARYITSDAIYDAKSIVTAKLSTPKAGSDVSRVTLKVMVPVMDTVDTSKKVGECVWTISGVLPKRATQTQRLDSRKYAEKLLGLALVTSMVDTYEGIY